MCNLIKLAILFLIVSLCPARAGGPRLAPLPGSGESRRDPGRAGEREHWFDRDLPGTATLTLPGSIEGLNRGPVWLQSSLMIPGSWKGKRVALQLERASGETRVWIDGQELPGVQDSLVAPQIHALGPFSKPATRRLTIRLDPPGLVGVAGQRNGTFRALEILRRG